MVLTPFLFTLLIFNNVQRLFRHFLSRPSSFFMWTDWFELSQACNVWSKFAIRHPEAKKGACQKKTVLLADFKINCSTVQMLPNQTSLCCYHHNYAATAHVNLLVTWFSLLPSRNCSVIIKVARVCYQLRVAARVAQRLVLISTLNFEKKNFSNAL